jgi:hypothetical protein
MKQCGADQLGSVDMSLFGKPRERGASWLH